MKLAAAMVVPGTNGSWRGELDGVCLRQASSSQAGKARETQRTFGSPAQAIGAFDAAARKKLAEGFVSLGEGRSPRAGEVLLHLSTQSEGPAPVFDLSPDGSTLAIAVEQKDQTIIRLVDVESGVQRPVPGSGEVQGGPVRSIHFDATGRALMVPSRLEGPMAWSEAGARNAVGSGPNGVIALRGPTS